MDALIGDLIMYRPAEIKTVDEKIEQLKENIIINLNMAEAEGFTKYYPYIKQDVEMLQMLRKAKKVRDKKADITEF